MSGHDHEWDRVWELFQEALEADAPARAALLEATEPALRREVESLLEAHRRSDDFLEPPGAPPEDPLLGRRVGPYLLREALGAGGMGAVYLAEQLEPVRRRVAIKLIRPDLDSAEVLARFEAERQALALLNHPNVAVVYDAGTTDDCHPYFAMEYVAGPPLDQYAERQRLGLAERLRLLVKVCRGVHHAHRKGIVHRDLKPSNIVIASIDGEAVPKVIDFGIAKATGLPLAERAAHTGLGKGIGTPAYMSPEQLASSGAPPEPRSDVYALGVILERLVAQAPSGDGARLEKRPRAELEEIVARATARDPGRRYASAVQLAAELEGVIAQLVAARPRRALFAGLALGLAIVLAGVGFFLVGPFSSRPENPSEKLVGAPIPAAWSDVSKSLAVTVDDLPHGGPNRGLEELQEINGEIASRLHQRGIPAVGFVNEGKLYENPGELEARTALLEGWLDAGHELGNHTFSHLSLHHVPLEEYQRDVVLGEEVTRPLLAARGLELRYFRHPYLRTGLDLETKRSLESFLAGRGYTVAPVTIENSDWLFAAVYRDFLAAGDRASAERLAESYLAFTEEIFTFFEEAAEEILGRQPRHVLLLHVNQLNADVIDRLLDLIEARDYGFVSLEEALEDPAYGLPDTYAGPAGTVWLFRWDWSADRRVDWRREPEPPPWVRVLWEGR